MEYGSAKVILSCGDGDFTAGGKHVISEGYKVYENNLRDYFKAKPDTADTYGAFHKPPKRYSESNLLSANED